MSRDEMIAVLVSDTVERMVVLRQVFWLQTILEDGFAGYAQWSDGQLRDELRRRGIGAGDGDGAGESADGDAYDADLGDECAQWAGAFASQRKASV